MSKRRQHPLILAMSKFDQLLASLDNSNADAFRAYVRNKVSLKQPKQPTIPSAPRKRKTTAAITVDPPLYGAVSPLPPSENPSPSTQEKPVLCTVCGNTEEYQDHFQPSPNYHFFAIPATSAPRARKKSSPKDEEQKSIPSMETNTEIASSVTGD